MVGRADGRRRVRVHERLTDAAYRKIARLIVASDGKCSGTGGEIGDEK